MEAVQSVLANRLLHRKKMGVDRGPNWVRNQTHTSNAELSQRLPLRCAQKHLPKSEIRSKPRTCSPAKKRLHQFHQRKLLDSIDFHVKHVLHNCRLVKRVDNEDDPNRLKHSRIPKSMLSFDAENDKNDLGSRPCDALCGSHQPAEDQINAI